VTADASDRQAGIRRKAELSAAGRPSAGQKKERAIRTHPVCSGLPEAFLP
jgi:hypothetical protein